METCAARSRRLLNSVRPRGPSALAPAGPGLALECGFEFGTVSERTNLIRRRSQTSLMVDRDHWTQADGPGLPSSFTPSARHDSRLSLPRRQIVVRVDGVKLDG